MSRPTRHVAHALGRVISARECTLALLVVWMPASPRARYSRQTVTRGCLADGDIAASGVLYAFLLCPVVLGCGVAATQDILIFESARSVSPMPMVARDQGKC
ncbi:hypothetical protein FKP32DRAFT_1591731 [Trametes sanguinea]|nr:hypothetical protein FKP32DRAFT_1591731 [Trametes sanguinea]